jgi:hypothetical protein
MTWSSHQTYIFLHKFLFEPDGVLYHYEFVNRSNVDFDSVQAVTDPRMISPLFHDVRLERTYVHDAKGFGLLASEIPERVTMPLDQWLPNRYRISYAWPAEEIRVQKQADVITFLNASRRADEPVIATISIDAGGLWQPSLGTQEIYGRIPTLRASMPTRRSSSAPQQRGSRGEDVAFPWNPR